MLRVILVDDEMLVRKRLRFGFDWNSMGYEIVEEADNGIGALQLIEESSFDLAIVDIAMPGMNGIELAKAIREKNIPVHLIFLTGHSEFKYAQEAVRYGIHDYILKPIDEDEFCSMLKKLSAKIMGEREKNILTARAGAVMEAKVFSDFFHDALSADEIETSISLLEKHGMSREDSFYVILYRIESSIDTPYSPESGINRVSQLFGNHLPQNVMHMVVEDIYRDNVIVLIRADLCIYGDTLIHTLEDIREKLVSEGEFSVPCGMSKCTRGFDGLRHAYGEAVSALNNAKVLRRNIMTYEQVEHRRKSHYRIEDQMTKILCQNVGKLDFESCRHTVESIFSDMFRQEVSFECISMNVNRLLLKLVDAGMASELDLKRMMNGAYNFDEVFDGMSDVQEITVWFEGVLFTLMESTIRSSTEIKSLSIIDKTCAYIRAHYEEADLNQGEIAEAMSVTQSYISGIFKKMMGVSMVQYITMIRMEKARQLLLESGFEVREAAEAVGYSDEYYFSRSFKKYYGISPLHIKKIAEVKRIKGS